MSRTNKNGIIAILDALGVSNLQMVQCHVFLDKLSSLIIKTDKDIESDATISGILIEHRKPKINVFGDTIVLVWDLDGNAHDCASLMSQVVKWLSSILVSGIDNGILFRGAVSVGNYAETDDQQHRIYSIIGDAYFDAAKWHQNFDFVGAVATPECGIKLFQLRQKVNEIIQTNNRFFHGIESDAETNSKEFLWFNEWEVPVKGSGKMPLYVVPWPEIIFRNHGAEAENWFFDKLSQFKIPFGTEAKYFNTINYFLSYKS